MTLHVFLALLVGSLVIFALSSLVDLRRKWKDEILQGVSGVKDWRDRLNKKTDSFVALGAHPLLARGGSVSADPNLSRFTGQTLAQYRQAKEHFIALIYAYNCGAKAVQQAEGFFQTHNPLKLANIRKAAKLGEDGFVIKEINPQRYLSVVAPGRYDPKPPFYHLDYLFVICDRLTAEVNNRLQSITSTPASVRQALAKADDNDAAAAALNQELAESGVSYLPYQQRQDEIKALRDQIAANVDCDPLGALSLCSKLEQAIAALTKELQQAKQQQAAVVTAEAALAEKVQWVEKVRATRVTCPWSDDTATPVYWTLTSPDSNPDGQLAQSTTLLAQARQSLASGQLATVGGECNQANAALNQAVKMVNALFASKTSVDEMVPKVRAELAAVHAQLASVSAGENTQEMARLVEQTCKAVESRISEVYGLYLAQQFPEALNLLTGTAGNEYGLPVAKLLAQAKELLTLLQKAAQVASTLTPQKA